MPNKRKSFSSKIINILTPVFFGLLLFLGVAYPFFKRSGQKVSIFVQETFDGVSNKDLNETPADIFTVNLYSTHIIPEKIYIKEGSIVRFINNTSETLKLLIPINQDEYTLFSNEDIFRVFKKEGIYNYSVYNNEKNKLLLRGSVYVVKE